MLAPSLERGLGLDKINELYAEIESAVESGTFFRIALDKLDLDYEVPDRELEKIPAKGPLIVMANHPFGGLEGLVMGDLLCRKRDDVKLLGNYLLDRIPKLAGRIIPVNPFGGKHALTKLVRKFRLSRRGICNFKSSCAAHFIISINVVNHLKVLSLRTENISINSQ